MSCCGNSNTGSANAYTYSENTKKTSERGKSDQKAESRMVSKNLREK